MTKITKRMQNINKKFDITKQYDITEAIILLKELSTTKFIESIDVSFNLGIDPRKSDQNIRGATILPHGTGRNVRVAVFTQGENYDAAITAGAELVGMEDLADKIKNNKINFDIIIASPDAMHIVGQLGPILGPRGLMPNPKFGTVTTNITKAIQNAKFGQINYRNDKNGIIHAIIGKINFDYIKLKENFEHLLIELKKIKPSSAKGVYIKKISLSTTMGVGININQSKLLTILV